MTKLEMAFAEAAKLPLDEQDALATWLLEEIKSEKRWSELFAASEDKLAKFAKEALDEYQSGKTQQLDTDTL